MEIIDEKTDDGRPHPKNCSADSQTELRRCTRQKKVNGRIEEQLQLLVLTTVQPFCKLILCAFHRSSSK